jgi:hypothetical protein
MTTSVGTFVDEICQRGIVLWAADDRLHFRAPRGAITEALRDELKSRQHELIRALQDPDYSKAPEDRAVPMLEGTRRFWARIRSGEMDIRLQHGTHFVARVTGALDVLALERTLNALVARHSALRARVVDDGNVSALAFDVQAEIHLRVHEPSHTGTDYTEPSVQSCLRQILWAPLDLETGPLFRPFVIKVTSSEWVVGFILHHLVSDYSSVRLLADEMLGTYQAVVAGTAGSGTQEPLQYSDYVFSMERWLQGPAARMRLAYWMQYMQGVSNFRLPQARAVAMDSGGRISSESFVVSSATLRRLRVLARDSGVSLVSIVLAAKMSAMAFACRATDATVLMLVSGRASPTLATMVGGTITYMPLRIEIQPDSRFGSLIAMIHDASAASAARLLPYEIIEAALAKAAAGTVFPMLNFIPHAWQHEPALPAYIQELHDLPAPDEARVSNEECANHWMHISESEDSLRGEMGFSAVMYEPRFIADFLRCFCNILDGARLDVTLGELVGSVMDAGMT